MADTYKFKVIKANPEYPDLKGEVELTLEWAKKVGLKGYAPVDQEYLEMVNETNKPIEPVKDPEPVKVEAKEEKKKK